MAIGHWTPIKGFQQREKSALGIAEDVNEELKQTPQKWKIIPLKIYIPQDLARNLNVFWGLASSRNFKAF